MARKGARQTVTRLNIYVPDAAFRRQVKTAAAKRDLSASEYCLRAITAQLIRDGERRLHEAPPRLVEGAVAAARRFQTESFGGRVFSVGSADLIREAREERSV